VNVQGRACSGSLEFGYSTDLQRTAQERSDFKHDIKRLGAVRSCQYFKPPSAYSSTNEE